MAGWPELCWVMSQVRDRAASTGLRDEHLTCSNYWKQHWEHGNVEVVEVAWRFQISLWASWGTLRGNQDCKVDVSQHPLDLWNRRASLKKTNNCNNMVCTCSLYNFMIKSVIYIDNYMDSDLTNWGHKQSRLIGLAVKRGRRKGVNQRAKSDKSEGRLWVAKETG